MELVWELISNPDWGVNQPTVGINVAGMRVKKGFPSEELGDSGAELANGAE